MNGNLRYLKRRQSLSEWAVLTLLLAALIAPIRGGAQTFTLLHSFAGGTRDGQYPRGSLIQASDGNLYGMTLGGGAHGYGAVFKVSSLAAGPPTPSPSLPVPVS